MSGAAAHAKDKIVGVSWSNFQEERWKIDEAAIKAAVAAAGDKYISADAQSSAQKQLTDIESLIAQGANDPRVKQAESEQIVAALTEAGIDHEYLLFPDEGHGFAKPENRLRFYAAAERFLARHLGGRAEE